MIVFPSQNSTGSVRVASKLPFPRKLFGGVIIRFVVTMVTTQFVSAEIILTSSDCILSGSLKTLSKGIVTSPVRFAGNAAVVMSGIPTETVSEYSD